MTGFQNVRRVEDPLAMQNYCQKLRLKGRSIAFVPTMGCLHDGHLSLIELAKSRADVVIASIFVNPMQFGPAEDLDKYPRTLEEDCTKLAQKGVSAIFLPTPDALYPRGFQTKICGGPLMNLYCGTSRPGHFEGVLTVVNILLNVVKPNVAIFGEKDFQQLFLIRQMCKDLHLDTEIVGAPIVREPNGLAMSSRNQYLSETERRDALALSKTLKAVQQSARDGLYSARQLKELARANLAESPNIVIDYAEIIDERTLDPVSTEIEGFGRILLAAFVGDAKRVRLIDNAKL